MMMRVADKNIDQMCWELIITGSLKYFSAREQLFVMTSDSFVTI